MIRRIVIFTVLVIVTALILILDTRAAAQAAEAPAPEATPELFSDLSIDETIIKYARQYNVSETELRLTLKCESGFRMSARGDGGRAYGIAQYHMPTWKAFSDEFGTVLDINSYHDQIMLTAWAFSKGEPYKRHWTCWRML